MENLMMQDHQSNMSDLDLRQEFAAWCKEHAFTMDSDLLAAFMAGAIIMRQHYTKPSFPPMGGRH
jgi:hypothetical protein